MNVENRIVQWSTSKSDTEEFWNVKENFLEIFKISFMLTSNGFIIAF